ncbi:hypothetical protein J1N35_035258 [Gossypium stocksii]|uniref:Uncharacterized protein n=1 Tax=Gossypium stocksii TaxID=47602 RepID=A0A9D3UTQ2_9ROSI|nr:hypothetical protein J1N35_035258 [Gossypium stocksii]
MLIIDKLQSSLLVHEQYISFQVEEKHALEISHGGQFGRKGLGNGRGGYGRRRGRQGIDKAMVEYYNCH